MSVAVTLVAKRRAISISTLSRRKCDSRALCTLINDTRVADCGTTSTNPADSRRNMASRMGVWLTPNSLINSLLTSFWPGFSSSVRIRRRSRSKICCTVVVDPFWILLPIGSMFAAPRFGTTYSPTRRHIEPLSIRPVNNKRLDRDFDILKHHMSTNILVSRYADQSGDL